MLKNIPSHPVCIPLHPSPSSSSASLFLFPPTPLFPPPFFTHNALCVCDNQYIFLCPTEWISIKWLLWNIYSACRWLKTQRWSWHTYSTIMNHMGGIEMTEWCESMFECFDKVFMFIGTTKAHTCKITFSTFLRLDTFSTSTVSYVNLWTSEPEHFEFSIFKSD